MSLRWARAAFGLALGALAVAGCVRSHAPREAHRVAPTPALGAPATDAAAGRRVQPALCATAPRVIIRDHGGAFRADGRAHHYWHIAVGRTQVFDEGAIDEWRTDLNADGLVDLGVSGRYSCASGGCFSAIYLNCGGGAYVTVLAPKYLSGFRPAATRTTTPSGESWVDLEVDVKDTSHRSREGLRTTIWRFDGTTYR